MNRAALERLFAAWRSGDAHLAAAHFRADGVYREAGREPIAGREAIAERWTRFFRDGPGWRFDVDALIGEGALIAVVYRFSVKGPADAWSERAGCAVVRFEDGAIAEWREYEG